MYIVCFKFTLIKWFKIVQNYRYDYDMRPKKINTGFMKNFLKLL